MEVNEYASINAVLNDAAKGVRISADLLWYVLMETLKDVGLTKTAESDLRIARDVIETILKRNDGFQ